MPPTRHLLTTSSPSSAPRSLYTLSGLSTRRVKSKSKAQTHGLRPRRPPGLLLLLPAVATARMTDCSTALVAALPPFAEVLLVLAGLLVLLDVSLWPLWSLRFVAVDNLVCSMSDEPSFVLLVALFRGREVLHRLPAFAAWVELLQPAFVLLLLRWPAAWWLSVPAFSGLLKDATGVLSAAALLAFVPGVLLWLVLLLVLL